MEIALKIIIVTILGILAFLIGFVLGAINERYDQEYKKYLFIKQLIEKIEKEKKEEENKE